MTYSVKKITPRDVFFYLPPFLVFVVGIYLTFTAVYYINSYHRFQKSALFANDALHRVEKVKEAILDHAAIISQFRNYFLSANSIDRQEFSTFASPLLEKYPGIKRIEWIPRVLDHERPLYEADSNFTERNEKGALTHAGARKEYFPIFYVEPIQLEKDLAGYDLASDDNLKKALFLIAKTGKNFSVPVVPIAEQTNGKTPGTALASELHVFAPIYLNLNEEDESHQLTHSDVSPTIPIQGFIRVVLDIRKIVSSTMLPLYPRHIDISIEDLFGNKVSSQVYYYSRKPTTPFPNIAQLYQDSEQMLYADIIHVLGRTWQITCISYDRMYSPLTNRYDWCVIGIGLGMTLCVTFYLCILTHSYRKKLTQP